MSSAYPEKTHDVVAVLKDGRIVAYSQSSATVLSATTATGINITFPDLKQVEYVLQVQLNVDPYVDMRPIMNKKITGNVVGMTVYAGAGTTLTIDAIAIGPP